MGQAPIVVFDLDNTLVHSKIDFLAIRRAVIDRLEAAGALAEPPADPRALSIPEWLAVAEAHDPTLAADLWRVVATYEREGMLHGTVEADARQTLDALKAAGYRLAVLSNNSVESVEAALERFDLRAPFDLVLGRGVVRGLKPGPDGVAQAHAALGSGPTVVVGDSYIDGLAAARAGVGARFIAFRANPADLAARGVHSWATIHSLSELLRLLLDDRAARWSGTVPSELLIGPEGPGA